MNEVRRKIFSIVRSHEYTKGLLRSIPNVGQYGRKAYPDSGNTDQPFEYAKGLCISARAARNAMKICIDRAAAGNADA